MKKLVLTLLAAVAVSAHAGTAKPYFQVGNSWQENRITGSDSIAPEVVIGAKNGPWQYSGRLGFSQPSLGNGSMTNTAEARLRYNFNSLPKTTLRPWSQLRLGEQIKTNDSFSYYALDLGLTAPLTKTFDFETNRYGVEGKFKFTDKDSIGVRYTQSYGDSETDALRLQYTRAF